MSSDEQTKKSIIAPLEKFSAKSVYGSAFCKRPIEVQILVEDDIIIDVGASAECEYSQLCLDKLMSIVKGQDVNSAWAITGDEVREKLNSPPHDGDCEDCDTYAVAAFKLALRNWEKKV